MLNEFDHQIKVTSIAERVKSDKLGKLTYPLARMRAR